MLIESYLLQLSGFKPLPLYEWLRLQGIMTVFVQWEASGQCGGGVFSMPYALMLALQEHILPCMFGATLSFTKITVYLSTTDSICRILGHQRRGFTSCYLEVVIMKICLFGLNNKKNKDNPSSA